MKTHPRGSPCDHPLLNEPPPSTSPCPQCGAPRPFDAPGGHCPQCLIRTSFASAPDNADHGLHATLLYLRRFGDYELLEEIARGGMGVVYRAHQRSLNRPVAVKMLLGGEFAAPEFVRRFRREAEAAARLRHPNIVAIYEFGHHDGQHFLAMECIEGRNLAEIVRDQPLPARRAATYVRAITQAVAFAHEQGVLHRDLKPSNVLIDARTDQPRITDFGLAKRLPAAPSAAVGEPVTASPESAAPPDQLTISGRALGSPAYMAPEQAAGRGDVGPAVDLYSLGALLYHLLTGRPPFQSDSLAETLRQVHHEEPVPPRRLNPSVPRDLETLCLKCLEKDPARRYRSATELGEELDRWLNDVPIRARPLGAGARAARFCRRRPAVAGLGASVLALLVVVAVGSSVATWRIAAARRAEHRAREHAEFANRELRQAVQGLELQRAEDAFQSQDSARGVAHLAALLRRDPSQASAAQRLVSALVHGPWLLRTAAPTRHPEGVRRVEFRPDGRQVLSLTRGNTAHLLDPHTGHLHHTLAHAAPIQTARYSPDGRWVVTASMDGTVRRWSSTDGHELLPVLRHPSPVRWAEFSPDGTALLTAADDGGVRLWNAATGEATRTVTGPGPSAARAQFNPDGTRIVTLVAPQRLELWDARQGTRLCELPFPAANVQTLAFDPTGSRLAAGGDGGWAFVWNLGDPEAPPRSVRHAEWAPVWHVAFSPDGHALLTTAEDGTARVWDAATGFPLAPPLNHEGGVVFAQFHPDGRSVVTTSADVTARLWDWQTGQPLGQPLRHHEPVRWAAFTPDGTRLMTASDDATTQLWDIAPRTTRPLAIRHPPEVTAIAYQPQTTRLWSASADGTARGWDVASGEPVGEPLWHPAAVRDAQVSRDGKRLVTGCADGTSWTWDLTTQQRLAGPVHHDQPVLAVQFAPDTESFVTASQDGTARIWETRTGQPITAVLRHAAPVVRAVFDPRGARMATVSEDDTARVWDARTGQPLTEPLKHRDDVKWADFSPDGSALVTASTDNTACIWDLRTSQPRAPLLQHARIVERALFSPDGRRVATASQDRTARVWDALTGQALTPPLPHRSAVSHLVFSGDGKRLATAGWNSLVRLWDADTGFPLTEWLSAGGIPTGLCFDATGQQLAASTGTGWIWVWDIPAAPTPVPAWFPAFAEAIAGTRWNERGHLELLPSDELQEARQPRPGTETSAFYAHLRDWLLADPGRRSRQPW